MTEPIIPRIPSGASVAEAIARLLARIAAALLRSRIAWIVGVVLFIAWLGPAACATYVPPNMVGIKQIYYGGGAGIRPDVYGPGLHLVTSGVERMHLFPHDMLVINFSDHSGEASVSDDVHAAPSIRIQTNDGYNVQLDVSVLYRIVDPYRVFLEAGPGRAFQDRLVMPRADRIMRKTLGELNSEEFYQGPKRIDKAKNAHDMLAAELQPYGIAVDAVLVRRYVYDQRYQELIEGRKIKDQTVFLRQAEAKSAIEQRKRDTAIAEGTATTNIELSRGEAEVRKLKSQAELYRRKRAAEGKLLVELAEAKGTQLENNALQGTGSENIVGLKMAEVLRGVRVLVLSSDGKDGFNPLDLQGILKKFEVK